jgi:hypothetical protein
LLDDARIARSFRGDDFDALQKAALLKNAAALVDDHRSAEHFAPGQENDT